MDRDNKTEHYIMLNQLNKVLDAIDKLVKDGKLTRKQLTDIVLRRNLLAMKQVLKYMEDNLVIKVMQCK